jgi:endonuclease YncB( thermonuclease family)
MLRLSFSAPRDSDGDGLLDREGGRGVRVRLTTDPTQDLFDAFGRLLAYVTRRGGTNLEVAQLRAGWAKVFVFDRPFRQLRRFRAAQGRARRGDRGVWSRCGGDFHSEQ